VLEVVRVEDENAEQRSLDIYNEVWPHDRLTLDDVGIGRIYLVGPLAPR
jgi:hypothetical protein